MAKFSRAPKLRELGPYWRSQLQGIFCVYKPPDYSYAELCKTFRKILLDDLNQLPCYPGEKLHKNAFNSRAVLLNAQQHKTLKEDWKLRLSVVDTENGSENTYSNDSKLTVTDEDERESSLMSKNPTNLELHSNNNNAISTSQNLLKGNSLFSSKLKDLIIPPLTKRNAFQHRFVSGDMYEAQDIKVLPLYDGLDKECSGVVPICVGFQNSTSYSLRDNLEMKLYIRVYHLSGTLGWTTLDNTAVSKKIKRHSYEHVGKADVDKMCSLAQNMHQWRMLNYAGVVPGSQEAYELLKKGLVKPKNPLTPPLIYGVRCINFEPPNFTLEVHCVNESYTFLRDFIYKIGVSLRSSAYCSKIRRIRYGPICLEHALVADEWNLKKVCASIKQCNKLLLRKKEQSMKDKNFVSEELDPAAFEKLKTT